MQVMRAVVKHRADGDETKVFLIDANKDEDDILMREELDAASAKDPEHTHVWHTLSQSVPEGWKYDAGYVTEAMCRKHLIDFTAPDCPYKKDEVLALICGPPPMEKLAVKPNLEKLGFTAENMFTF
ncbi:hypothetical protein STCU_01485 [Strigomonas culicis]|nr:hypothetical protein STCU_06481 [Strigomonas culicis]EPY34617.1 hypothetical protein STCU_01485 [Strigomonas culicis]|eukprot:EPY25779.1 hypothetical protein STCU_06481 [Strigomonas culicis]